MNKQEAAVIIALAMFFLCLCLAGILMGATK